MTGEPVSTLKNNMHHLIRDLVTTAPFTTKFNSKWISDCVLTDLINNSEIIPETIVKKNINRLMKKAFNDNIGLKNNGIIITCRNHQIQKMGGKMVYAYYIKKSINEIEDDTHWWERLYYDFDNLMNDCNVLLQTRTATSNPILKNLRSHHDFTNPDKSTPKEQPYPIRNSPKRNLRSTNIIISPEPSNKKQKSTTDQESVTPPAPSCHQTNPIWQEKKTINLFLSKGVKINESNSVINAIKYQFNLLKKAYQSSDGWREVIDDEDVDNCMSNYDIFRHRKICEYLAHALLIAIMNYHPVTYPWKRCTIEAIAKVNAYHEINCPLEDEDDENNEQMKRSCNITNHEILKRHYITFRKSLSFPNPYKIHKRRGVEMPLVFEDHPDFRDNIRKWCDNNLLDLSTDLVHHYIMETALPLLVQKINDVNGNSATLVTNESILNKYGYKKMCLSTVNKWMHALNFSYKPRKKNYYVDNHERPDIKLYRKGFVRRYLEDYEIRCFRWMQITDAEREEKGLKKEHGFAHQHLDGSTWYEYHVDDHPDWMTPLQHLPFGGNLSVRKPPDVKPLIILGQDEAIFRQFLLTGSCWNGSDGSVPLVPKDDGKSIMISAFTCREFGFSMHINDENLKRINAYRKLDENKFYKCSNSAIRRYGTAEKGPLHSTPLIRILEIGVNNEGYWDTDQMAIQLEDVIDVYKVLFPMYDLCILLDHSNGHDKLLPDGLNPAVMNKGFGGSQPKMKSSTIKNESYLGPYQYDDTLKVGSIQNMVYSEDDQGPFEFSPEQREATRNDIDTGKTRDDVKLTKRELIERLRDQGVVNPKGTAKKLADQCVMLGLATTKSVKVIKEGWVGKPKGALQILYERGFIDKNNVAKYTMSGKKGEDGNIIPETSLREMLDLLPDFMEQETILQFYAKQLGVMIDRTPKCHPEVAGEGIEYNWGASKGWYRKQSLKQKRTTAEFRKLVERSISVEVLGLSTVRKCAAKARRYILAYYQLAVYEEGEMEMESVNMGLIERVTGTYYRRHRDVHNNEGKFINDLVDGMSKVGKNER
jgi:hypothetical protein